MRTGQQCGSTPQEQVLMRLSLFSNRNDVRIGPGDFHVTNEDVIISTLLGSCVSACLYDPVHRIMGMNHFLLASVRYGMDNSLGSSEAGRYGIHAMELLINKMLNKGAVRKNLQAKAFGGASVFDCLRGKESFSQIGELNCQFIKDFLRAEKIPLVSSRLGGENGRVIYFSSGDFAVYVREIKKVQNHELAVRDEQFIEKTKKDREKPASDPDIWT